MSYELRKTELFEKWFTGLKDANIRRKLLARLDRLENGNFGDFKKLTNDLFELRFFFGGGLRIYFTIRNNQIVLLLNGGNKSEQSKDIKRAKNMIIELE